MRVEVVGCVGLNIDGDDGIGDAVARRLVDPPTGKQFVETSYVGFRDEDLTEVLQTILEGVGADRDVGHVTVPSGEVLHDPIPTMCAFCEQIPADDLKIVIFDAGDDDAESFGRVAMLVRSEFDTKAHLDHAGMTEATVETGDAPVPKP
jgi:hypothetical protein